MTKEERYELIERFLEGKLAGQDLESFQKQLESESEFADELAIHKKIQEQLSDKKKIQLIENLEELNTKYKTKSTTRIIPFKRIISYASIAAALIFLGWFFLFRNAPGDANIPQNVVSNDTTKTQEIPIDPGSELKKDRSELAENNDKPNNPDEIPKRPEVPQFIASDHFEGLIASQNTEKYQTELITKISENGTLIISGSIESLSELEERGLQILVYDQNAVSPDDNQAFFKQSMNLVKEDVMGFGGRAVYEMSYRSDQKLSPGTYYFKLINPENSEQVFVGKIEIPK